MHTGPHPTLCHVIKYVVFPDVPLNCIRLSYHKSNTPECMVTKASLDTSLTIMNAFYSFARGIVHVFGDATRFSIRFPTIIQKTHKQLNWTHANTKGIFLRRNTLNMCGLTYLS